MALIFKIDKPCFVSSIKYKYQETTSKSVRTVADDDL